MHKVANTVLPKAFSASGLSCGIKKSSRKDLGLLYSQLPCDCAGIFTANEVKAAPLIVCMRQLRKAAHGRAVIVNSGNANCFVEGGIEDALAVVNATAQELDVPAQSVFVASTGIIGKPLPVSKIIAALPALCEALATNKSSLNDFAQSILTTDTCKKIVSVRLKLKGKAVVITGFAKGAGMIYPQLQGESAHATMLVFIVTDANIQQQLLSSALAAAAENSFNRISIDGCMSTNDTVLVLANGAAGNARINKKDNNFKLFYQGLEQVCEILARKIVEDGEGATKLIEITIRNAKSSKEAKNAAKAVMNSDLFKTAMFGNNPNWGRIVAAIGAAGVALRPDKLTILFNERPVFDKGKLFAFSPEELKRSKTVYVDVNLYRGTFSHRVYTSDLTEDYIKINAAYN